jgi:hypothetical protein
MTNKPQTQKACRLLQEVVTEYRQHQYLSSWEGDQLDKLEEALKALRS